MTNAGGPLSVLESEAIHVIREVGAQLGRPALLSVRLVQDSIDKGRVREERGPGASRNALQTTCLLDAMKELRLDAASTSGSFRCRIGPSASEYGRYLLALQDEPARSVERQNISGSRGNADTIRRGRGDDRQQRIGRHTCAF